jgi:hypothetical protein
MVRIRMEEGVLVVPRCLRGVLSCSEDDLLGDPKETLGLKTLDDVDTLD